MNRLLGRAVPVLAALLLAATGHPALTVSGAWVRVTPAGADTTAVYAHIVNAGDQADRLLSVETDAAEAAELHSMTMDGAMMVMRPVHGGLPVPPHGTLELKPGGYHVMLVHPTHPIAPGDRITVTLVFERAGRVMVPIAARSEAPATAAPMAPMPGMPGMPGAPGPAK